MHVNKKSKQLLSSYLLKFTETKKPRNLRNRLTEILVTFLSVGFAGLYIYFAGFRYFSPESYIAGYVGITMLLIFILYPMGEKSPQDRPSYLDILLIILTVACTAYYIKYFPIRYVERFGEPIFADTVFGVITIFLVIEACRRVLGVVIPALAILAIIYSYIGPFLRGIFAHPGANTEELVAWLFSPQSIYGVVASVFASFVFLFIMFGTILEMVGGRKFFIELPLAVLGLMIGGGAKLAIIASSLFGMISGSVISNVTTTGTFTIPLMKRGGYKPYMAAGVESAASTIGVTMPPIMGAAVFIMADFTGITYFKIVKMAIVPSTLFMLSLILVTDFQARLIGLRPLPKEELPNALDILKKYWHLSIPLVALIFLLSRGFSPGYAAFWCIILTLLLGLLKKETRYRLSDLIRILETSVKRSLAVGGLAGAIGIIIGVVFKTGIATKLSGFVIDVSGGSLGFIIFLTGLSTLVLGMGVSSITADYILLATLLAPALIELGASVAAAHLLIIWYTQTSNMTPPVCISAFAAAAIADANPWRTGFYAFRIALFLFIIPITFVYSPILNVNEIGMVYKTFIMVICAICFAGGIVGFLVGKISFPARMCLLVATVVLVPHHILLNLIGIALFLLVLTKKIYDRFRVKIL